MLARVFGASRVSSSGVEEFRSTRDSITRVVHVESATQAILDIRHVVNGVARGRWEFGYDRRPDGTLIQTRITAEDIDPRSGGRRITVTQLSNVRLEKRG
jgi:hypothetical protein